MNNDQQQQRNDAVMQALGGAPAPPPAPDGWHVPAAAPVQPGADSAGFPQVEGQGRASLAVWVMVDVLIGFVLAIILQLIVLIAFVASRNVSLLDPVALEMLLGDSLFVLISSPTLGLAFAAIAYLRIRMLRGLSFEWFNLHSLNLKKSLLWGTAAGFAFLVANVLSGLLFELVGSVPDQSDQLTRPFAGAPGWQIVLLGLFIVLIGPFLEEVFFRGYVQRALSQRLGVWWGIILSAIIFAAPHALAITTGFLGLLVPVFLGGVILGYVYYRTQNLWSAVLAHVINNGVAFIGLVAVLSQGA